MCLEEEANISPYSSRMHQHQVSIRQHTSTYVSIRLHTSERDLEEEAYITILIENALKVEGLRHPLHQPLHTSAYVSIRQQHASAAYVNIHTYTRTHKHTHTHPHTHTHTHIDIDIDTDLDRFRYRYRYRYIAWSYIYETWR